MQKIQKNSKVSDLAISGSSPLQNIRRFRNPTVHGEGFRPAISSERPNPKVGAARVYRRVCSSRFWPHCRCFGEIAIRGRANQVESWTPSRSGVHDLANTCTFRSDPHQWWNVVSSCFLHIGHYCLVVWFRCNRLKIMKCGVFASSRSS